MPGLVLILVDQFGAEHFSGQIGDLIDWLSEPQQNDLNDKILWETWEGMEDVLSLVFTFNGNEISVFDLEATRQFLCQLPLPPDYLWIDEEEEMNSDDYGWN